MFKKRQLIVIVVLLLAGAFAAVHAQETGRKAEIKKAKDSLRFFLGDDLVTTYQINEKNVKPIFWPLYAPGPVRKDGFGVPLTRSWPMLKAQPGEATDHPHQKSAWFCHGEVVPDGYKREIKVKVVDKKNPDAKPQFKTKVLDYVDFWSEAEGHGHMVCTYVGEPKSDQSHAWIVTKNEWRTDDEKNILDETRTIHLYDLGNARLIVVDSDLHADIVPITFGDTKEGSFGIRINDAINAAKGKGKIRNAEGKIGEKDCWGQISAWCDYSGPIDDNLVGLALLADPKNSYPSCWHVRGYGLMAANPFGREKHAKFPAMKGNNKLVRLEKGEHLHFRYGILLHAGDADSGQVAEHYQRFVQLRAKE